MGSTNTNSGVLTALASQLRLSATLEINELVQQRLAKGHKVVHLGFGEATFPIQQNVAAAHREASDITSYLPVAGLMKLRQVIAKFQSRRLGTAIRPDQVVIAPGSKPLLFALFDILQGDVLLPRPSWVSYEPQIIHAGKRVFWVETDEEDRHTITESSLEAAFKKGISEGGDPRIMLINSPSNPTGQAFDQRVIHTITAFCQRHNITLISDEIYSDITFSKEHNVSPCSGSQLNNGQKIMTGGLSKTYSAGGWRVGYAVFPKNEFGEKVQDAILAYASECWSAASAPAQEAAAVAFDTSPEMDLYRSQVVALHKRCTLALYQALRECGLAVPEPKGAFYVYPSFHPYKTELEALGIETSQQLSRWLIEECGVAALPGSVFGEDDAGSLGGRYRLRMATSYLYFQSHAERYESGYEVLASASDSSSTVPLPLLNEAIQAIQDAVRKLQAVA
ncbi:kynurenine-oxoglutarate transaminase [Trichoderma arundinaceum]|uniref:Kynurenine-oxoglutarate transaminase n=1 Tax=Trichoderma arundinaceum TaxID=490622 RepID=A0A395NBV5_TRIAR|nr:kynurenine-oxoglutarate transaminase [Trichoderma arundinaceum]